MYLKKLWSRIKEYKGVFKIYRIFGTVIATMLYVIINIPFWMFSFIIFPIYVVVALFRAKDMAGLKRVLSNVKYMLFPLEYINYLAIRSVEKSMVDNAKSM